MRCVSYEVCILYTRCVSFAGIPWLFANLALASFIKFKASARTAIAVTVIMGVACLYFFLTHGRWMRYVTGSAADTHALNVGHLCLILVMQCST